MTCRSFRLKTKLIIKWVYDQQEQLQGTICS